MYYAFISIISALGAAALTLMSLKIMQILQLSSYRAKGVFSWFKQTKGDYMLRYFAAGFFSFVCMLVFVGCFHKYDYVKYSGLVFYFISSVMFIIITFRQKSKTPLKFTPRVIRLTVLSAILFAAESFALMYVEKYIPVMYSLEGVLPILIPFTVLLAHYILLPFETLNNKRYENRAEKKLKKASVIKIGITGSYGKTTAKNILSAMLSQKYNVLSSPASYNTPLGIAKTVNYELNDSHNVFIAEMGARYKGDIAKLGKLVCPDIGVITAVGNQHLATFGSVENIAAAKYELIEKISEGGTAVFSSDNDITRKMYENTDMKKLLAGESGDVTYSDVSFGAKGTAFTLCVGGQKVKITTKLLGRHIPSLVALCAAVANELGVPLEKIAEAAENLQPVEHRLQLIENGDVTVIDDAYNSNVLGARNALEVLSAFEGTRIIITPGLVELGEEEESANYELGKAVFGSADYAYFVGARAKILKKGALDAGLPEDKIAVCDSLDDAVSKSGEISGRKTILFENDLPDNL